MRERYTMSFYLEVKHGRLRYVCKSCGKSKSHPKRMMKHLSRKHPSASLQPHGLVIFASSLLLLPLIIH
jgi:hypothetical protein